jgi:hypothetical protein
VAINGSWRGGFPDLRHRPLLAGSCGNTRTDAAARYSWQQRLRGHVRGRLGGWRERPEAVALARQLHEQGMGYRAIRGELAKAGHVNERGRPFHHNSVRAMLGD